MSFSDSRCEEFIAAVDGPEAASASEVLAAVDTIGITVADFIELDERPGQWDGRYRDHTWHAALRRVRNDPAADLFAHLHKET